MANRRIAKKKAEVKAAAVEAVKAPEVVETVEEKKEAVEETVAEPAAEAVEAAETEEAPKKRGRKPGAKNKPKETKTTKAVKETENKNVVYVETAGMQYKVDDVVANVQAAWVAEGHRVSSIKSLNVYINMDERMAYYVINDKNTGSVSL